MQQPSTVPSTVPVTGRVTVPVTVRRPFAFEQSLTFLRRFPPCRHDVVIGDDRVTAALAIGGRAVPFTVRGAGARIAVEVDPGLPAATIALVLERARQWLGADDDLTSFYAAAAGDHPRFAALVAAQGGLHHVRFLTLAEIAVHAVLMQRTPMAQAARAKQRFAARFGRPVTVGGIVLHAFPALEELVALEEADYREAIRLPRKAAMLPPVVRGVAAIGEAFLRGAPYAAARDALLAVPGIGPFSAAAILLRGLGRMDEVPLEGKNFAEPAREIYGAAFDPAAIRARYGADLGYWSFYLKTGVPQAREAITPPRGARARRG
ncbi:MAG TPA: hypothetical protein VHE35_01100 [Kofleriaceae bacterium]|nr:hypothetical protein [Kofleriaceae bacterium]